MTEQFKLSRLGQISVPIINQERAVPFYRDILGLPFLFEYPNLAFFDLNGVRLLLNVGSGNVFTPPGSILYFNVEDIHEATQNLQDKGVIFTEDPQLVAKMPDHDLWMSFFEDPEGNTLALMSEVPNEK